MAVEQKPKEIREAKYTCSACGNVCFYGKEEEARKNKQRNWGFVAFVGWGLLFFVAMVWLGGVGAGLVVVAFIGTVMLVGIDAASTAVVKGVKKLNELK